MAFELDHGFIFTPINAPEAEQLKAFGLSEGSPNTHPGQGTANRRFFFENFMVELLWVSDLVAVQSELIQPMHLWERWRGREGAACPFGICLRPSHAPTADLPFPTWDYQPPYLPPSVSIPVATNALVTTEPLLFYLPFAKPPAVVSGKQAEPLMHKAGFRRVTQLTVVSPQANQRSPALQGLVDTALIRVHSGPAYLLILGFDGECQGQEMDFRPALPLIFRW